MAATRKTRSKPYNSRKGCPRGYHKRASYKSVRGKTVKTRCVRSTTTYEESQEEYQKRMANRQTRRLERAHIPSIKSLSRKACPPGQIERKPYVRRYTTAVREKGFTVKRKDGTTYRVYPKAQSMVVKSRCIKDRGLPGKGPKEGEGIGRLRKGELKKYGYSSQLVADKRHAILKKAVEEYGPLGVYRKLDAVAKYTVRTLPEKSKVYAADRDWIAETYKPLVAFPKK